MTAAVAAAAVTGVHLAARGGEPRRPLAWQDITPELGHPRWARPTVSVIRDRRELLRIVNGATLAPHPHAPTVDLEHRQIILVAVGPRSSSGYALHIDSVTEQGGAIDVVVRERSPSLGKVVAPTLTFPFKAITVPLSTKRVHVDFAGR